MSAAPLNVLFVTPECAPWAKTGGLGDVSAALPRALRELGHDVRVLLPAYRPLRPLLAQACARHTWPADGPWPEAELVEVDVDGLSLLLLDCPGLYDRLGTPYGDPAGRDFEDSLRRFGFLSIVAARIANGDHAVADWSWPVDVVHGNDWPTALAMGHVRRGARGVGTVFTVHNLAFQGVFPADRASWIDLPPEWLTIDGLMHWDQLCLMKAGFVFAHAITAVSPTYAEEICTEAHGCGLDGLLRARRPDLVGILNGIDASWNPASDRLIAERFDAGSLPRKGLNRRALQQRVGLPAAEAPMLFGMVSRMTEQKGVDLVLDNLGWLVGEGHQLVVLGKGDAALEARLRDAAGAHPSNVSVTIGFDEPLAHLIEAGADAFLMPSRFEPCGLNQMYSQAYGTPPIVRRTGGLADSVTDADAGAGTGFVFDDASPGALQHAMARAAALRRDAAAWEALQRRGMAQDFGWEARAEQYVQTYRNASAAARR